MGLEKTKKLKLRCEKYKVTYSAPLEETPRGEGGSSPIKH
jgi:hypothetical protein